MDPGEDLSDPPISVDPYAELALDKTATDAEIKSAYKKLALKRHPDKAPESSRAAAHKSFQDLAFAYAILSDPRRRARYDRTGSTAETLDDDEDPFDWAEFFRAQFREVVTTGRVAEIRRTYQGSAEERTDVLAAYTRAKGNLDGVFENVMLSSVLDDEERFRAFIDGAIKAGEVEGFKKYVEESESKKQKRRKWAERERDEAEEAADDMGIHEEVFGKTGKKKATKKGGKKSAKDSEAELAALIQQRQSGRAANFMDNLEAKYGGGSKRKKAAPDEPGEEAFAEMGRRAKKSREASAEPATARPKRRTRA